MDLSFFGTDLLVLLMAYGSLALLILLGMGIFGLPVPEETLLVLAGRLMKTGDMPIATAALAAYVGVISGITISYILGRTAGRSIVKKYGKYLPINKAEGFSKGALLFGYLVPGLRHFTGIFAGSANMQFKDFALYAYTGAFFWVFLYLSIGYFWSYWFFLHANFFQNVETGMDFFTLALVLIFIAYIAYKKKTNH